MANHFRLFAAARTVSLGQVLRMVDAEAETTVAPAIWWRLLHKSAKTEGRPAGRLSAATALVTHNLGARGGVYRLGRPTQMMSDQFTSVADPAPLRTTPVSKE